MCDDRSVTSDEIREAFLSYFEQRDHKRLASASLVPASYDPSVLLTTAGMHPLKPYFQGLETPPHHRLTTCQKCFRTPDIDVVGTTTRHLTFFEMLGNFSLGDYFKEGAAEFAWEMSLDGFGFDPERIWVTVFEGDEALGLGPDEEAIAVWEKIGVPRERIVLCPRSENFWQAGETGPCGPCSELYYDRGLEWGTADDLPGGENERFLEYWNLVFMQYNQDPVGTLTPLPNQNIDTGLGLNRMALIQQGVDSIFDTDQFVPLMELGRSLATNDIDERALRILADHSRGMTFMIADGVVPSNEDRGYVLRRLMRRAIAQGHRLGFEGEFLPKYVEVVMETMGAAYPELGRERDAILRWVTAEEQGFGRTLETGLAMLDELLARGEVSGEDAFKLHDTFGFPIDLTVEIAGEREVPVDIADFDTRMEEQRLRSSAGAGPQERVGAKQEVIRQLSEEPTAFTGYEHLEERTTIAGVLEQGGRTFVKLASSPFYAQGGGQVSDAGVVETEDGHVVGTVNEVLRSGEDQAVVLEGAPSLAAGAKVVARVDRAARQATQANHTATHLLHAALREALGTHVRQAGSYVGPDKLRFDFTHGTRLAPEEVRQVEDRVNCWILANDPVRPITTTLKEAQELGAMALFGEKYGDVVRMVQIGGGEYSRELCGGTHVRSTAEIGVFRIVSEGSSASNVRRIEAVTGPEAVTLLRSHDALIREAAGELRTSPEQVPAKVADLQQQLKAAAKAHSFGSNGAVDVDALAAKADELSGVRVLTSTVAVPDAKALLDATDRVKNVLGDAAIVLGAVTDGKVALIASVAPALVARGIKAGELVKVAAQVVGGGGGGRDTMAQAGGRDPEKLDDALAAARAHIERALAS
jgi:alanyl-tRNA synthetase